MCKMSSSDLTTNSTCVVGVSEEEMSSHVKIAQEERDKLVEEVHALKEQKDSLERGKESVQRQIDELVSSFSNEEVLMGRVLENGGIEAGCLYGRWNVGI